MAPAFASASVRCKLSVVLSTTLIKNLLAGNSVISLSVLLGDTLVSTALVPVVEYANGAPFADVSSPWPSPTIRTPLSYLSLITSLPPAS